MEKHSVSKLIGSPPGYVGYEEGGQLTDGLGNQVDFRNTIIIMTSNLGARFLEKRGHLGFSAPMGEGIPSKIEEMVRAEVKRAFNPEFLNRLDDIILFTSLNDDDLLKIIDLMVNQINLNLEAKQLKIHLTPDAAKYLLEKTCADRAYGARPLRRALQKFIEDPLSEALIQGALPRPGDLEVYLGDAGIYYRQVNAEAQPVAAGAEPAEVVAGVPLYTF